MKEPGPHRLDDLDRHLLDLLQRDASLTNQELAARVGLSSSPCLRRVKALEDAGILQRRVALLDSAQLGLSLTVRAEAVPLEGFVQLALWLAPPIP